jgi:hypothetical protein
MDRVDQPKQELPKQTARRIRHNTEGIGLWLEKRWAEWLTVIITSSLVPIEIYEIYRHPSPVKISVFLLNIAIVVYLVYRIRNSQHKSFEADGDRIVRAGDSSHGASF